MGAGVEGMLQGGGGWHGSMAMPGDIQRAAITLGSCVPIPTPLHPQIFMKYGRQRWKLRGRIEVNSKQVWDSEEMVFLPLVTEFLSIKVQCRKGQGWVGQLSCCIVESFRLEKTSVLIKSNY